MRKNILVISTSLRKNSNTDALAESFAEGAREAGCHVEIVSLRDKQIAFCNGCLACRKAGRCVIPDDANPIAEKMKNADAIAFATPVYYYGMSGQMKTLIDRANPLYGSDYAFRDIYLLAAAADPDSDAVGGTLSGLEGWISCFSKARLSGTVFAPGAVEAGAVIGTPAMEEARLLGKKAAERLN
ncbi:flavodoxin family protein [Jonquetella anthropi]|uniref:flavodoxin family protein n=1 Tax=Jonquetella anthropi TaxID=428712 RepID=UPI0001B91518|nr:flavodoxin family protein [Jonquetella anthropi]EEX47715.1 flavin reductase [Jonquetella anthropi E3_33 E1]